MDWNKHDPCPYHKRKKWFVSIRVLNPVTEIKWNAGQIKIERMRSSGPGGQRANKTEGAIRVTHLPTGLAAISQEERSQHLNNNLALLRLDELLLKNAIVHKRALTKSVGVAITLSNEVVQAMSFKGGNLF